MRRAASFLVTFLVICELARGQLPRETNDLDSISEHVEHKRFHPEGSLIHFSLDVHRVLARSTHPGSSHMFSPISIVAALNLLLLGSSREAERQMRAALHYPRSVGPDVVHTVYRNFVSLLLSENRGADFSMANAIFVDKHVTIGDTYAASAKTYYNASVQTLDFVLEEPQSRRIINEFVSMNTRGKISKILTEPINNQLLILANAVYFKGLWQNPFDEAMNQVDEFFVDSTSSVLVTYMVAATDLPYWENQRLNFSMFGIPYKGSPPEFGFFVILPNGHNLEDLENSLTTEAILEGIENMRFVAGMLSLPKMKMEGEMDLMDVLRRLNVTDIFDPGKASLRKIANTPLFVSSAYHRANIEVSEQGTEVSASTIVLTTRTGAHRHFLVNRPFLFFVRDNNSGAILLWARITRPVF